MKCSQCGSDIRLGDRYCSKCGASVNLKFGEYIRQHCKVPIKIAAPVILVLVAVIAAAVLLPNGGAKRKKIENGIDYLYGTNGAEQDFDKAREMFESVGNSNAEALYYLGKIEEYNSRYDTAMDYYVKAAEMGFADALKSIGEFYEYGCGVETDYTKAKEYYENAIAEGCVNANNNMCSLYLNGWGVPQDDAKALAYYQEVNGAPDYDNAEYDEKTGFSIDLYTGKVAHAYIDLANAYQGSDCIIPDEAICLHYLEYGEKLLSSECIGRLGQYCNAVEYIKTAAALGCNDAIFCMGDIYSGNDYFYPSYGDYDELIDYEKARYIYEYLIRNADSISKETRYRSYYGLARIYEFGLGVEQDTKRADEYYEKYLEYNEQMFEQHSESSSVYMDCRLSCYNGEGSGMLIFVNCHPAVFCIALARYYDYGRETDQDKNKAIEYYEKAADLCHDTRVGAVYLSLAAALNNSFLSEEYYLDAYDRGIKCALTALGIIFHDFDRDKSQYYFNKAVEEGDPYAALELAKIKLQESEDTKTFAEGLQNLEKLADDKNIPAIAELALLYLSDYKQINIDEDKAQEYINMLSEYGTDSDVIPLVEHVKYNVGLLYYTGEGIEADRGKAKLLFMQSPTWSERMFNAMEAGLL